MLNIRNHRESQFNAFYSKQLCLASDIYMYLCSRSTQKHRSVAGFEAMDALSGVLVRIGEFHVGNFYISNLPDGVSLLLFSLYLLRNPEELMRNIALLGWPYSFARVSINDSANWR